jgi:hypothetical protein
MPQNPKWGRRRGEEVARYGKEYKDRVVARLLPPESAPVDRVSAEVGVMRISANVTAHFGAS